MLLNCHTYFSFHYGTLSIEALLEEVRQKGYRTLVLSDINNTSAILDALRVTEKSTPKVIPGIDFRNGIRQMYIGIAKNNEGFRELNEHLTRHLHEEIPFDSEAPAFENAFIIYPFASCKNQNLRDNEFIGISAKELSTLPFSPLKKQVNKMVVLQALSFLDKKHHNLHRLLRAIDNNTVLSKLSPGEQAPEDETALPEKDLLAAFSAYPEITANTQQLLDACSVQFAFGKLAGKNKKHYTSSRENDIALLRQLAMEGLGYRYPSPQAGVMERIEKELDLIARLNFASYYLINWDITRYARSKGYFYVGRGSGANSMIAYLLRITDVDPVELDLYFERFINEYRSNAPDFDIDFSWTDRDDMTRYIFDTFGREHTALLATYATYQKDAVIRELGKVFGLPAREIDALQHVDLENTEDHKKLDQFGKLVVKYSKLLQGFPSHLSIHASGIIISEEPISTYTATILPPKGYPTTQFSMQEAEDIGLFKFDILSQRGLGKIKDAIDIIRTNHSHDIDIHNVREFIRDEDVKNLLRVGKCIGCFYVESPAMRMLLSKLQADDYRRLVAASSIIRPGVSKSGMMREYIVRFRNPERREEARQRNTILYKILEETYGVMVYQEDVIRVAHEYAGLSLADSDYLRRGMSWKFKQRNEFHVVRKKFFDNCEARQYNSATTLDIWQQIESFANFAFSKGHSASYAVESYQALYLKAHYPIAYMVATLNNGGGFYRKDLYIHEARMHGAEIVAPCVNSSTDKSVLKGNTIFLGMNMISDLEENVINRVVSEREAHGPYISLYDFIKRTSISIEQLRILIRVGAFQSISKNKRELLWEAHMLISPVKQEPAGNELFDIEPEKFTLPKLENNWLNDAMDEIELLGFSLCSPFKLLKDPVKNTLLSRDLAKHEHKTVEIVGYLVNVKTTRTVKNERMHFGTFLDMEGYWIDTVHFPPSAREFPFTGPGCYRIIGRVVNEFDFIYLEVSHLYHLPLINQDEIASTRLKPVGSRAWG
jgi:DNA polymerase-3 subunit alpha